MTTTRNIGKTVKFDGFDEKRRRNRVTSIRIRPSSETMYSVDWWNLEKKPN